MRVLRFARFAAQVVATARWPPASAMRRPASLATALRARMATERMAAATATGGHGHRSGHRPSDTYSGMATVTLDGRSAATRSTHHRIAHLSNKRRVAKQWPRTALGPHRPTYEPFLLN